MKSKTRIVIIAITVLLVILVVVRVLLNVFSERRDLKSNISRTIIPDITVVGSKVKVGNIEKYITLYGDMRGIEEANAFPDVSGKVDKIVVVEGDYVKKDQPIMYIDRSQIGFSYNLSPVRAPISGRVGNISVSEGQLVLQTSPVATIVNDSVMEIVLLLPEVYITKVKKGMNAIIQVSSYPNEKFIGYIHSIDTLIDKVSRTLKIKVRVRNPERKLISGMYCTVKILVEKAVNTVYVPNTSIKNIDGEEVVFVLTKTNLDGIEEDNIYYVSKRKVKTGISDGNFTSVQGLKEGEIVVSLGVEYIKDGTFIRVVEE
ncbi:MAG: efflux RND transporter periplasmic adaptor subunit [Brevinematia bacterium]